MCIRSMRLSTNQQRYMQALQSSKPIVLATGPAGVGKTMLACNMGVNALKDGVVDKLVITRPLKTADEELGYLPGDIDKKFDPYMQPLYDCFFKDFSFQKLHNMKSNKIVDIVPLAFMRGRTFENTWIIADEMQNATHNQLKMLLTRLGTNSKMVITGDLQQKDITTEDCGLEYFLKHMYTSDLLYTTHIALSDEDVKRHASVSEILQLYNTHTTKHSP